MRQILAVILLLVVGSAQAATILYDFSWTGANDYTMSGSFSFDDSDGLDGGLIDETEVLSFSMEGFLSGSSIGSYSGTAALDNFNFNSWTGEFLVGGFSHTSTGQSWNSGVGASELGFESGSCCQVLFLDGSIILPSITPDGDYTLEATFVVPIPAAVYLFGSGLGLLGWIRRRQTA